MILSVLLAALGAAASSPPPDDVDRFISICVAGGKNLLDQEGKVLDRKDVPKVLLGWFGSPGDRGSSSLQYFSVGQGWDEVVVGFEQLHRGSVVQSKCTLVTAKFDATSGKRALLQKLSSKGIEDVTAERFIVGDVNANGHERAYQNPIVQDMIGRHQRIEAVTLQTADPKFEIFGRPVASSGLYAMSVFNLSEKDARDAKRAWDKCQKANCSLP
ncbi:MAG TPA: hypothetical protein VLM18_13175 [Croceibacterium sp.]|nr:hypothetical protein [Croceibacterium sp.]